MTPAHLYLLRQYDCQSTLALEAAEEITEAVLDHVQTEGESNALKFSQMFHLAAQGSSFVITNGAHV